MAHDHDHQHDTNTYYFEQLFTIGTCAALGFATIMWWVRANQATDATGARGLSLFIVQRYHPLVLGGGIGLLALVVIRAIAVWRSVDRSVEANGLTAAHDHEHEHEHHHEHEHEHDHAHEHHHDHDHAHDHEHHHDHECEDGCEHDHGMAVAAHSHGHGHGHGHDHDHGWAPWRYVVLLLPTLLFVLNLPSEGFGGKDVSSDVNGPEGEVADKGFAPELGFKQLEMAALTPETRAENTGKTVKLIGKYAGSDDKRFSLTRYKMTCCAADSVPINAVIMVDPNAKERLDPRKLRNKWVEVTGQVQFLTRPSPSDPSRQEYTPAVIIYPKADKPLRDLVRIIPAPADPYLN
jgi:hypothetical protein